MEIGNSHINDGQERRHGIVIKQVLVKRLGNIPLEGRADIIWQMPGNRQAVWDLKYSDGTGYYHSDMRENAGKAWQLTAYQKIFPGTTGLAFWLIKNDSYLGTKDSGIGEEAVVDGFDAATSWNNLVETLGEMDTQLKNGILKAIPYSEDTCKFCRLSFVCGGGYGQK